MIEELKHVKFGPIFRDRYYAMTSRMGDARDYSSFGGKVNDLHEGSDYDIVMDAPNVEVCSVYPGDVYALRQTKGYGLSVKTKHYLGNNKVFYLVYAHLERFLVSEGDEIWEGKPLGILGSTGNSKGKHVHLTMQVPLLGSTKYIVKEVVDPDQFFNGHTHTVGGLITSQRWEPYAYPTL